MLTQNFQNWLADEYQGFTYWFDFERSYPGPEVKTWVMDNRHWSLYLSIVYAFFIFLGRRIMANRKPFVIRGWLAAWNAFMFLFSLAITVRILPYLIYRTFYKNLHGQVCDYDFYDLPSRFWIDMFVLTKPIEFIDTAFIVLRKQNLNFLHWYHHCSVTVLCWYSHGINPSPGSAILYIGMNAIVHTVMYLYYLMRSLRIRVPRRAQMSITVLQILQMVVGVFVNAAAFYYKSVQGNCCAKYESIIMAFCIYGSYLFLFADFFSKAYFVKKTDEHAKKIA